MFTGINIHAGFLVTAIVALTGAAILRGGAASADGQDDAFLANLAAAGIPAHDGIPAVIAHGHDVCNAMGAGMSPGEAANELAQHAYGEDPSQPFDRYLRSMQAFVRVSVQTFCPGEGAAYHGGYRIVLAAVNEPQPPPQVPDVPDAKQLAPPVQVAPKPKMASPPKQMPPPPPKVIPPPSAGSKGGQGRGPTGGGANGGGTSSGPGQQAPDLSGGHISLLP